MIETGSMAPCLLGYHRSIECPGCHFGFATEEAHGTTRGAICPNCGQTGISVADLVRDDGDQLLVQRTAYEYQRLRRWEVVAFRNPSQATQTYVKRIVALPGERVQIIDGDIFIAGQIQPKDLLTQRSMRIPVHDYDFRPPENDPDWQPRWVADSSEAGWSTHAGVFTFDALESQAGAGAGEPSLVRYRHWVRAGGQHKTSIGLARWPDSIPPLRLSTDPLQYDARTKTLVCRGGLSNELRDSLIRQAPDEEFRMTIERLYDASHLAPILDACAYNRTPGGGGKNEVRDLMLCVTLNVEAGTGLFVAGMDDGAEQFECVFDLGERQVRLVAKKTGAVVRTALLPRALLTKPALVELSLMDRQVLVAVNGVEVFEPWKYSVPAERGPTPWKPVWFGARNVKLRVSDIKLYRDVFYTPGEGRRGFDGPFQLRGGELFALGDNSPVSKDSRSWPDGKMLTVEMLLGKPFLVHLPSRRRRLTVGGWHAHIRIPECSQIRYIR